MTFVDEFGSDYPRFKVREAVIRALQDQVRRDYNHGLKLTFAEEKGVTLPKHMIAEAVIKALKNGGHRAYGGFSTANTYIKTREAEFLVPVDEIEIIKD